jgi:hypothetical protein
VKFELVFENNKLSIEMKQGSMNLNAIYLSDGDAKAWEFEDDGLDPFRKKQAPGLGGVVSSPKTLKRPIVCLRP